MVTTNWQAIQKSHNATLFAYSNSDVCYAADYVRDYAANSAESVVTFVDWPTLRTILPSGLAQMSRTRGLLGNLHTGLVSNESRMRGESTVKPNIRSHVPLKKREGSRSEGR